MTQILGIDPGGTTGWVRYLGENIAEMGETVFDDIFQWISQQHPDVWVVENYRIRPPSGGNRGFTHAWDKGEALQIIGAIKLRATEDNAQVVLQEPVEKVMGYKLMGKEYVKGKKGMHIYDANAHVHVYFAKQQRRTKK